MYEADPIMPSTEFGFTVQELRDSGNGGSVATTTASALSSQTFLMHLMANVEQAPPYWSRRRDEWMVSFVTQLGNDLLAGAMSTLIAKVATTNFYIEGPMSLAIAWIKILRDRIGFEEGWTPQVSKWVRGYLNRDAGGLMENLRSGPQDLEGPSMGWAHLDESLCTPTRDKEYPVVYHHPERGPIKMHKSQVSRMVDTPDGRDKFAGVGFCSVSRSIATALILMDIVRYKRERLSDLPPAAILLLNNLTDVQWQDIISNYDTRQHNQGNTTWRDVLVACGYDPAFPISAELFELSSLPEHYDDKVATEVAIYTFALAFRVDPREYWPVSAGPLGTATEATIQHKKAKAKGEGIIFSYIERILNGPYGLPEVLKFKFDYREDEDDEMQARIVGERISNVRKLWEASPNQPKTPEGAPFGSIDTGGMISTDEARSLLLRWDCIPPDVLGMSVDIDRVYDIKSWTRTFGPWSRVYLDGRVVPGNVSLPVL